MYDSTEDTEEHQRNVVSLIYEVIEALGYRAGGHDDSKLGPPEKECFDEVTPKLKGHTYGSPAYISTLREMDEALKHHYLVNRHHPEHFADGVKGMNLIDLIEMFCDWKAATLRHADGDMLLSIDINKSRFHLPEELVSIFKNTVKDFFWQGGK